MKFEYKDLILILAGVFGVMVVLILPTMLGIMWKSWTEAKKAIERNTHAIIQLTSKFELSNKYVDEIPKLKSDMDSAHKKIRDIDDIIQT